MNFVSSLGLKYCVRWISEDLPVSRITCQRKLTVKVTMVKVWTGQHFALNCTSSDCGLNLNSWLGTNLVTSIVNSDFDWYPSSTYIGWHFGSVSYTYVKYTGQLFGTCWFDRCLLCGSLYAPVHSYQHFNVWCSALYLVPTEYQIFINFMQLNL